MKESSNQTLGAYGEALACTYLQNKGYAILEKNWRSKVGEIDIIARHGGVLVFVEVKCRSGHWFGYPEEAITERKKQHLTRALEWYCVANRYTGLRRADAVAITARRDGGNPEILHLEDILPS